MAEKAKHHERTPLITPRYTPYWGHVGTSYQACGLTDLNQSQLKRPSLQEDSEPNSALDNGGRPSPSQFAAWPLHKLWKPIRTSGRLAIPDRQKDSCPASCDRLKDSNQPGFSIQATSHQSQPQFTRALNGRYVSSGCALYEVHPR